MLAAQLSLAKVDLDALLTAMNSASLDDQLETLPNELWTMFFAEDPSTDQVARQLLPLLSDFVSSKELRRITQVLKAAKRAGVKPEKMQEIRSHYATKSVFEHFRNAAKLFLENPRYDVNYKLASLEYLAYDDLEPSQLVEILIPLIGPQSSPKIQQASQDALLETNNPAAAKALVSALQNTYAERRRALVVGLLSRAVGANALLDAIEAKELPAEVIDAAAAQQLRNHPNADIRQRAHELLHDAVNSNRAALVEEWKSKIPGEAKAAAGKELFKAKCAVCHRFGGEGATLGPDLASVQNRTTDVLLIAILDPNRAVDWHYNAHSAVLNDGRTITGVILEENANSVTLGCTDGSKQTFLRRDLESLNWTASSLMPEGLEEGLTPQNMADLLAYLQSAPSGQ
jgi:putative heme-binding domain-containing protein